MEELPALLNNILKYFKDPNTTLGNQEIEY